MGEQKRKIKPLSIVCFVLAAILAAAAVFFIFFGKMPEKETEQAEPVDVYLATKQDEHVYLNMQYMTEPVAYVEAVESMQYYIAIDSEWSAAVICMNDEDAAEYQKYIDWLYTEEEEGGPEEIQVTGYSVPFDDDLRQWVMESYNYIFGMELINKDNFEDYFGQYYLNLGQSSAGYEVFNTGIYCLLGVVVLIIIGVGISYKSMMENGTSDGGVCLEVQEVHRGRGIIGALLGALLGGVLWTVVGALGYISGWIGLLIFLFAATGYKLFAKEESSFGKVISIIFSLLVVFPATYLAGVWIFYQELNAGLVEYITLGSAFKEFGAYLTKADAWGSLMYDIGIGYVFMIFVAVGSFSKKKNKKVEKVENIENIDAE